MKNKKKRLNVQEQELNKNENECFLDDMNKNWKKIISVCK